MNGDGRTQLRNLTAQATLKYSVKDYNAAAELYSQATELQAEINGELSSGNADLLYAYGRCLYHVAVKNSDVLGSKVAGERREEGHRKSGSKKQKTQGTIDEADGQQRRIAEEVVTKVVEEKDGPVEPGKQADRASKQYFRFIGDENFDTSDEQEEGGAEAEADNSEDADEEDDFVNAYEVLDLARVLFLRKLEEVQNSSAKGKEKGESQQVQQLKERLADIYDLLAEISLEGERFPNAVVDLNSALELKKGLFPQESSLLAEAHFKLSLALEFSSVTQQENEDGEADSDNDAHVDESMREEAALEMEAAIASCRLRIKKEEASLLDLPEANGGSGIRKVTEGDVADVKEMVWEMEQRLVELRQPPVSINDPTGRGMFDGSNPLSGILGSVLGESPAAQKARLEEASRGAKDLTNLIKRKKSAEGEVSKVSEPLGSQSNGKRKVDFKDEVEEVGTGKKPKISDSAED
ncbi:MAG: hypothetical protein ALECFALPRED_006648 [Alectoria fallacina]|uniref:Tetratricopeptide SHNi-TPR domain-containing protein n=1 Tax=Alectoria fallacina TaxID=1903189 RepID=A0A8H3G3F7_9LECA|nr:MAG: hypothetical protein ALECFALPRED_006648 [Alectoria fallacina]